MTEKRMYDPEYFFEGLTKMSCRSSIEHSMWARTCVCAFFTKLEARIVPIRLIQKYDFGLFERPMQKFPLRQFVSDFKLKGKGKK